MVHDVGGLSVLCRGWLHGNSVLLPGTPSAIIDTGYHTGAADLIGAFESTGARLADLSMVLLTHIHSDHAGGVAALAAQSGACVLAAARAQQLVRAWVPRKLWLGEPLGQHMPRFAVDRVISGGEVVCAGGLDWRVIDTPGHAMGGLSFYCAARRLLVTGDALWQHGFGLLNPWIDGPGVFERAVTALDNLAALDVETVIPGHGSPFTGHQAALDEARHRLEHAWGHPDRLRRQVIRNTARFIMLANPGWPAAAYRTRVLALARALQPLPGDTLCARDEDLAASVWAEITG